MSRHGLRALVALVLLPAGCASEPLEMKVDGPRVGNLVRPKGVAGDDEGNLYVAEPMHDTLLVFDRGGRLLMSLEGTDGGETGRFHLTAGVWVDARSRVYVATRFRRWPSTMPVGKWSVQPYASDNAVGGKWQRRVFVSFDYDNDLRPKDLLVGQSKNEDSPFELVDSMDPRGAPQ